jgi:hypothetical protein
VHVIPAIYDYGGNSDNRDLAGEYMSRVTPSWMS